MILSSACGSYVISTNTCGSHVIITSTCGSHVISVSAISLLYFRYEEKEAKKAAEKLKEASANAALAKDATDADLDDPFTLPKEPEVNGNSKETRTTGTLYTCTLYNLIML